MEHTAPRNRSSTGKRFMRETQSTLQETVEEEDREPIDRHLLESRHDIGKVLDGARLIKPQWYEHMGDEKIAQHIGKEAAVEIRNDEQNNDGKAKHPAPAKSLPGSFRRLTASPCILRKMQSIDPSRGDQQQDDGQEIKYHLTVSCKLVADVDENSLAASLRVVAHEIAGRRHEQHESCECAESPRRHPKGQVALAPRPPRKSRRQYEHRNGKVFHRPTRQDAKRKHRRDEPMLFGCLPLIHCFAMKIVRHEKEGDDHPRPQVDGSAAFPNSHLAKMWEREPGKNPHGSKNARLLPEASIAPRMDCQQYDEHKEHQGVGNVEDPFAQKEKDVEKEECCHASAMQQVMTLQRFHDVRKRSDVPPRLPDHRIVIVVAMQRHEMIERIHQRKDSRRHKNRLPDSSSRHAILPPNA